MVEASSCVIKVHTSPDGEDVGWGFRVVITPVFDHPLVSTARRSQHRGFADSSEMLLVADVLELSTAVRMLHPRTCTHTHTH